MRVLQVITPSKLAGAEVYVSRLSTAISDAGHDVTVCTKPVPEVVDRFRRDGLTVEVARIGGKLNPLSATRLSRIIRVGRFDVVNSHLSTASLASGLAGRLSGVPVVATVHALNSATCYRFARRIIAVSEAVRGHIVRQGIPDERVTVIYPGVDIERFSTTGGGPAVRADLGIPADALVVGMLAHLSPKKGHTVLLEAAERILAVRPDCRFLLAGDGPMRGPLAAEVKRRGLSACVIFTGFREDVVELIESTDIVVLPSVAGEGLPASLIQAMLLSRPVVGSGISGIPEIVDDGVTGFLVKPGDPSDLSHAILSLVLDAGKRREMGRAGRERAARLFDFRISVDRTLRLYGEMVDEARR